MRHAKLKESYLKKKTEQEDNEEGDDEKVMMKRLKIDWWINKTKLSASHKHASAFFTFLPFYLFTFKKFFSLFVFPSKAPAFFLPFYLFTFKKPFYL